MSGSLWILGIGPGGDSLRTPAATEAIAQATDLVGYGPYLALVPATTGQVRHSSDNRQEADRARQALDLAAAGARVAVVSSGDPGIFAMASAVLEQLDADSTAARRWAEVTVQIVPGVTAATATAALVGAPLGHDFCVISLSDVLKPWHIIEGRIDAAAAADFVLAFYNPISKHRPWQLDAAMAIVARHRAPETPVVLGRALSRAEESVRWCPLAQFDSATVDMSTTVIVGSSTTRAFVSASGQEWVYTPRHYPA